MGLLLHAGQPVQVGDHPVQQVQTQRAAEDAQYSHGQGGVAAAVLQRGQDQTNYRRRQHHARGKGENKVAEGVGYLFEKKP